MNNPAPQTCFVVIDEHTFGYINPLQPNVVGILATSVIRGALPYSQWDGWKFRPLNDRGMRPATRADFDIFRCSTDGYDNNPRYDMPQ